jgi:hypothetical protein
VAELNQPACRLYVFFGRILPKKHIQTGLFAVAGVAGPVGLELLRHLR